MKVVYGHTDSIYIKCDSVKKQRRWKYERM